VLRVPTWKGLTDVLRSLATRCGPEVRVLRCSGNTELQAPTPNPNPKNKPNPNPSPNPSPKTTPNPNPNPNPNRNRNRNRNPNQMRLRIDTHRLTLAEARRALGALRGCVVKFDYAFPTSRTPGEAHVACEVQLPEVLSVIRAVEALDGAEVAQCYDFWAGAPAWEPPRGS